MDVKRKLFFSRLVIDMNLTYCETGRHWQGSRNAGLDKPTVVCVPKEKTYPSSAKPRGVSFKSKIEKKRRSISQNQKVAFLCPHVENPAGKYLQNTSGDHQQQ